MVKPDGVQRGLVMLLFPLSHSFFLSRMECLRVNSFLRPLLIVPNCNVGQVGDIISRFERKGFQLVGLKMFKTPKELAEVKQHCIIFLSFAMLLCYESILSLVGPSFLRLLQCS